MLEDIQSEAQSHSQSHSQSDIDLHYKPQMSLHEESDDSREHSDVSDEEADNRQCEFHIVRDIMARECGSIYDKNGVDKFIDVCIGKYSDKKFLVIHAAQIAFDPEQLERLIKSFGKDYFDLNELLEIAVNKNNLDLIPYLVNCGADISNDDNYCLKTAASNCEVETLKALVKSGADIHYNSDEIVCHVGLFSSLNLPKTMDYLKEAGCDLACHSNEPIKIAVYDDNATACSKLIDLGLELSREDVEGLIEVAIIYSKFRSLKVLMERCEIHKDFHESLKNLALEYPGLELNNLLKEFGVA